MAWLELHQELPAHPKTLYLAALLKIDDPDLAWAKVARLWLWALQYCLHGRLTVASRPLSDVEIARASNYHGDATVFVRSLIDAGWIDVVQGGVGGKSLQLHDWEEYAGRLAAEREKDRERKRVARSGGIPTDGGSTVPNRTVPYRTQPEEGEKTPPSVATQGSTSTTPAPAIPHPEVADTVRRFSEWKRPGDDQKAEGVLELLAQGVSHERIRDAATLNKPADVGFWDIVKALKVAAKKAPSAPKPALPVGMEPEARPNSNPTGFKPPVLRESREDAEKRLLGERKAVDKILAKLPVETLKAWTQEAERLTQKLPTNMRPLALRGYLAGWAKDPKSFKPGV